jgi:hypothetical protein
MKLDDIYMFEKNPPVLIPAGVFKSQNCVYAQQRNLYKVCTWCGLKAAFAYQK